MGTLVEKRCFVKSDHKKNNNKFWNVEVYDDGSTVVHYGRVGDSGTRQNKNWGSLGSAQSFVEKKIREKTRSGRNGEIAYREIEIVEGGEVAKTSVKTVTSSNLESLAKKQIQYKNPNVENLITYLTKVNAHQISAATGGQITFNDTTGLFSTPLGIVTQNNIDSANDILVKIGDMVANNRYTAKLGDLTNDYLMLVPQDIGRRRLEVSNFWSDLNKVQKQKQIVDSLQSSLVTATTQPTDSKKTVKAPEEKIFDVQLDLVEDGKQIDRIVNLYKGSRKSMHSCSHYEIKKVYSVDVRTVREAFEAHSAKMDNIWELWHGSSASNLLSILKGGLIIPPKTSSNVTGRMFSDGIYASNISTKALGYSTGFWGQKSNRAFMFLLDMAMGKYHVPSGPSSNLPARGYDSTFAKPGKSGIMNEEMIVYSTSQVNLKYLIELTPHGR